MARQRGENVLQLPIHALDHIGGEAQQLIRRASIELRIGAKKDQKILVFAFEARLYHGGAQIGIDARHFLEADLVDGIGRQIGGGEFLHLIAIPGNAIGQIARGSAGAGAGQIFGAQEGQHPRLCRIDDGLDHLAGFGAQLVLLERRNRRRHQRERRVERAVLDRLDLIGQRRVTALHGDSRRGKAPLHARAHVGHILIKPARNVTHPADIVAILLHRTERHLSRQIVPHIHVAVDRHLIAAPLDAHHFGPQRSGQHRLVQALRRGQFGIGNGRDLIKHALPLALAFRLAGRSHTGQTRAGPGIQTILHLAGLRQAPLPFGIVDGLQPLIRRLGLSSACQKQCGDDRANHVFPPQKFQPRPR